MDQIKIVAVVGSLRRESYNRQLALAAKEMLKGKADFEILEYQDIPFMNQDIEFPAPDSIKRVRAQVKAADGLWFFSPEYNHFFPGVLKNLIDWLSRQISETEPQVLAGKPAALKRHHDWDSGDASGAGPSGGADQPFEHGCDECASADDPERFGDA